MVHAKLGRALSLALLPFLFMLACGDDLTGTGVGLQTDATPPDDVTELEEELSVTSVTPGQGPIAGGTLVVVRGTGFKEGVSVQFGEQPATAVTVVNNTFLTAISPAGEAGNVDLRVSSSDAEASLPNAFRYETEAELLLYSVRPSEGSILGGMTVILRGEGFKPGMTIRFGNQVAEEVEIASETLATCLVPSGVAGAVDVTVSLATDQESRVEAAWTYLDDQSMEIVRITPNRGKVEGGELVMITGEGFDPEVRVFLGEVEADVIEVPSSEVILISTPSHVLGTVDLTVVRSDELSVTEPAAFNFYVDLVMGQALSINQVTPREVPETGGTPVLITGTGFEEESTVTIGGEEAETIYIDDEHLIAIAPVGAGNADLVVQNSDGTSTTLTDVVTFVIPVLDPPILTAVSPQTGPIAGQTQVTLSGAGFVDGATILFGMRPAGQTVVVSENEVTVRSPIGQIGSADITVINPDGQVSVAENAFAYFELGVADPTPILSASTPSSGWIGGGDEILLTGASFGTNPSVRIGEQLAEVISVRNGNLIRVRTPAGESGEVDITVTTDRGLSVTLRDGFVYFDYPPALFLANPNYGPLLGGGPFILQGAYFAEGAEVRLDGILAVSQVLSGEQISVTPPPHAVGPVDIEVTNPSGLSATLREGYRYALPEVALPPEIESLSPSSSLSIGGESLIIRGAHFSEGAEVLFGDIPATEVSVFTSNLMTALIPAGEPQTTVDLTVRNPDGQAVTLENGFSYTTTERLPPLSVNGATPSVGSVLGNDSVTISGGGFTPGMTVHFGLVEAPTVLFVSSSQIVAVTPTSEAGTTDIIIRRPDQQQQIIVDGYLYRSPQPNTPDISVTRAQPAIGPIEGGTPVRITGSGFTSSTVVRFGDHVATSIQWIDGQTIMATSPAANEGPVTLAVEDTTTGALSVLAGGFTYFDLSGIPAPQVFSLQPYQGVVTGGDLVSIAGSGFQAGVKVYLCGYQAEVSEFGINQLRIRTAAGQLGMCDVEAVNPDGQVARQIDGFRYVAPRPEVVDVMPAQGSTSGGTSVLIRGDRFIEGVEVRFGGVLATSLDRWDEETIIVTTPAGQAGVVNIRVINPGGLDTLLEGGFTYLAEADSTTPPRIDSISPARGPIQGGTPVEVYGAHFMDGVIVNLGGQRIAAQVIGSDVISFITPAADVGSVDLSIINPNGLGATLENAFTYTNEPQVQPRLIGIAPTSGPMVGGQPVTISGANLSSDGVFFLGSQRLNNVTVINANVATALTPAGIQSGATHLRYVAPTGVFAQQDNLYTYVEAPDLQEIGPIFGAEVGGTEVVLIGAHFQRGARVYFGGREVDLASYINAQRIVVTTPAHPAAIVDIEVVNPDGQKSKIVNGYEYLAPPRIELVTQATGPVSGGTVTRIKGTGFVPGTLVFFDDQATPDVTFLNSSTLAMRSPPHAAGAVNIRINNPDGQQDILLQGFTYVAAFNLATGPSLDGVFPAQGIAQGGDRVLIFGADFAANVFVFFGDEPAPVVNRLSPNLLEVISPVNSGVQPVTVMNLDGQVSTESANFTYLESRLNPETPLDVSSINPPSGPTVGQIEVTLVGEGFTDPMVVLFDDLVAQDVNVIDSEHLTLITPASSAQKTNVIVYDGIGQVFTFFDAFTFVPPPQITGVTPNQTSVSGGVVVKISGQDFSSTGGTEIHICSSFAEQLDCQVISEGLSISQGGTEITFTTPENQGGVADIAVINPDGQSAVLEGSITYNPNPEITAVQPVDGSTQGGSNVTISGAGFQTGLAITIGGTPCGQISLISPEVITCITGQSAAGAADIVVTNPDLGRFTFEGAFTFIAPPAIDSISPASAAEVGGARVTISGSGFVEESEVLFGALPVPVQDTQVLSPTVISLITPPGVGLVSITIQNPDGQSVTRNNAFTYIPPSPPPTINYAIPNRSEIMGGQLVQIIGSNFLDGAQVFFGKDPDWYQADVIDVTNRGTLIKLSTPAVPEPMVVDIRIQNTDGQERIIQNAFEYVENRVTAELGFVSVSPSTSVVSGGRMVTISGQGMVNGVNVYFGKEPEWALSPNVEWYGPTLLRAEVPDSYNGLEGLVDIKLSNPPLNGPDDDIAEDAFEYTSDAVLYVADGTRLFPEKHDDRFPISGDFTGDGRTDILVMRNGNPRLLINTVLDNGEQGPMIPTELNFTFDARDAAVGDIDNDGDLDLVLTTSYDVYICRNPGNGLFTGCSRIFQSHYVCDDRSSFQVDLVDLSCDGALDIFVSVMSLDANCPNFILTNNGTGQTFSRVNKLPSHLEDTRAAAFGDIDLDGDTDILLANDNAMQNRLYLNNCANIDSNIEPVCYIDAGSCSTFNERYNDHTYQYCTTSTSWESANWFCDIRQAKLSTPNSIAEFDYIRRNTGRRDYIWLGWTDKNEEGVWLPSTGDEGQPLWGNGEPNGGTSQNYVYWYVGYNYVWDTGSSNNYFMCEMEREIDCTGYNEWQFTDAQPGVNFPISGGNTRDVALLDINRDGFLDAIIGNADQRKNVYINNQGNFQLDNGQYWPQLEEDTNTAVDGLYPADIDGDGDYDIIMYSSDNIRIYDNDYSQGGIGAFTEVTRERLNGIEMLDGTIRYNVRGDDRGIALGDLDGDLLPDIYITNDFYSDYIMMNRGYKEDQEWIEENRVSPGHFEYNTSREVPQEYITSRETEFADYDGDGDLDLIKCTSEGLRAYDNIGGRFVDRSVQRLPQHSFDCADKGLELVDFTGDGADDIMVLSRYSSGYSYQFVNDGEGHFTEKTNDNLSRHSYHWTSITAVDLDLDQDIDFLFGVYLQSCCSPQHYYSRIYINGGDVLNNDGAFFLEKTCNYLICDTNYETTYVRNMKVEQVDDDIWPDVYVVRDGQNQLLLNAGSPTSMYNATAEYLPALSDNSYDAVFLDADLDGDTDIYVGNNGQDRFLVRESADKFSDITASSLPNSGLVRRSTRALDVADLNGDGLPEIIIAHYESGNTLLTNLGANVFDAREPSIPLDFSRTVDVDFVDFDGDGDLDAYITNIGQDFIYENKLIDD